MELDDFVREATLCASLYHRSIVAVLGVGFMPADGGSGRIAEESIFMVTELCNGGCLRKKIVAQMMRPRKAVYSWAQGAEWCAQVADGLAFLHAQQPLIIHRDVKLDNILLHSPGGGVLEAKLGDFGLHASVHAHKSNPGQRMTAATQHKQDAAKGHAESEVCISDTGRKQQAAVSEGRRNLSGRVAAKVRSLVHTRSSEGAGAAAWRAHDLTGQTGSFLGMAPEVTLGQPYNEKADIFSLGCVLFDVLGKRLTSSEVAYTGTPAEFQRFATSVAYGYRRPHPQNWPPELGALVAACLAQEPAKRPSAREVAARLRELAASGAFAEMDEMQRGGCCLSCIG